MKLIANVSEKERLRILFFLMGCAFLFILFSTDAAFAVEIDKLKDPIKDLKKEIFGGWMMVVKIGAAATGIILSAFRGSLAPFGIGAGIGAGTHFLDKWLGDGAAGALI